MLRLRPDPAEQGWAQHDACQQGAHQRGLANALHAFAQQPSHHQQQQYLRHQQAFGLAAAAGAIACRAALAAGVRGTAALGRGARLIVALALLRGCGMDRVPDLSQLRGGEEKK